ncbi:MAG: hypothetical protein NTW86_21075 [Candidatus Sumerlaeota bacterium]|nr:hypothetical protein [Candidatus Sumerlaeota bacterium]
MRCVIKLLVEIEAMDDPAARKVFRRVSDGLVQAVGDAGRIRSLKIIEDGVGRPIDRWEGAEDDE